MSSMVFKKAFELFFLRFMEILLHMGTHSNLQSLDPGSSTVYDSLIYLEGNFYSPGKKS